MEGLLLTLKKWRLNAEKTGCTDTSYYVWGYYDVLEISEVNKWNEFSPKIISDTRSSDNSGVFSNEIQLKLLKPNYASKFEEQYAQIKFTQTDHHTKPLLTIVLLRFTENIVKQKGHDKAIYDLNMQIASVLDNNDFDDSEKPLFAVYPSIGFMDAIMICQSNNFASIASIIFSLRGESNLLYTSYAIPCIKANPGNSLNEWKNCPKDKVTQISIRVTLKPGVATKEFIDIFKKEINAELNTSEIENEIYFEMFGNSDVLILSKLPASRMAFLYLNEKSIIQPKYELVTSTRSSIRILSSGTGDRHDHFEENSKRATEKEFYDMISAQSLKSDRLMSSRLKDGLCGMANFYFDLTSSPHAFDIRNMMDPVLSALIKNIDLAYDENVHEEFTADKYNDAISKLRDSFTDLMNDFARANKHMFEGRWFKHPAIASAGKLIMAYHTLIADVIKIFQKSSTYTFLTTSGGVDHVTADSLFNFYIPNSNDVEHRLIILKLPEAGLFCPALTLFYSLHEVFHFVGERNRDERNKSILQSLAYYTVDTFKPVFWNPKSQLIQSWKVFIIRNMKNRQYIEHFDILVNKFISECCPSFEEEYYNLLSMEIDGKLSKVPLPSYSVYWENAAYNAIARTIEQFEAMATKYVMYGYHTNMYGVNEIKHKRIPICVQEVSKDDEASNEYNTVLSCYKDRLATHFKELFGDTIESDNDESIFGMFYSLNEIYRESFADMCSVVLLKSSKTGYLSAFYPEEYLQANKQTPATQLRITSVLKVCFPNDYDKELQSDDNDYNKFIKDLLSMAENHINLLNPLIHYLTECKQELEKVIAQYSNELAPIQKIYASSQPISIKDIPSLSYASVMEILNTWHHVVEDEKN